MKFIVLLPFFALIAIVYLFIRFYMQFKKKKEAFIQFCIQTNDYITLQKLKVTGFSTSLSESHRVMYFAITDYLFEMYQKTKKIEYLHYDDALLKIVRIQIGFSATMFLLLCIILYLVSDNFF